MFMECDVEACTKNSPGLLQTPLYGTDYFTVLFCVGKTTSSLSYVMLVKVIPYVLCSFLALACFTWASPHRQEWWVNWDKLLFCFYIAASLSWLKNASSNNCVCIAMSPMTKEYVHMLTAVFVLQCLSWLKNTSTCWQLCLYCNVSHD